MKNHNNFNSLHIFSVCSQVLSFRKAADQLHLTQSAVAQRVRQLEMQLGVKLFDRKARGLQLTSAGETYATQLMYAFEIIQNATADITKDISKQGAEITLATTPSLAAKWLVPRLASFKRQQPEFDLHIEAGNEKAVIGNDGVDCAIRLGMPPFGKNLRYELLFSPTLCLVAPVGFSLEKEQLSDFDLVVDSNCRWEDHLPKGSLKGMNKIKVSQSLLAIDAVIAGQGVTVTPLEFVQNHLQKSELVMVSQFDSSALKADHFGFYYLTPRDATIRGKHEAVRGWIFSRD